MAEAGEMDVQDLDDAELAKIELRQRRKAEALAKELWDFAPYPQVDAVGVTRHGYGRAIHERALSVVAAEVELSDQFSRIQDVLRFRIYEILGFHPDAEDRIAYLYLVADIFKPEELRDWDDLWTCVRAGDWEGVAVELMSAEWEKRVQMTKQARVKLLRIINRIQHGEPAA